MLEIEALSSLDALLWLQSGKRSGALLGVHQSTVSRRSRECLGLLGMAQEHCSTPDPQQPMQALLLLERQLHQRHRLRGGAPLRLHANYWARHQLLPALPPGWIAPDPDPVRPHADPLALLEARIVDAALLSGPEVRLLDRQHWRVVDVSSLPLEILVPAFHPLARETALQAVDLASLAPLSYSPVVPLPVQRAMAQLYGQLGAGGGPAPARGVARPCLATAFTRHLWPGYVPLDAALPVPATDHLVVLAALPWEARLDSLLDHLRRRLRSGFRHAPALCCYL